MLSISRPLSLWAQTPTDQPQAHQLADALGIMLVTKEPMQGPMLCLAEGRLLFRIQGDPELTGSLWVDFDSSQARRRICHSGQELLVQAARIRHQNAPLVVDATAGLGRDGFLLAAHGCRVIMMEQHPVVAALLANGLARARLIPELAPIVERIQLLQGNACDLLPRLPEPPDVISLDPMFPARTKSAKVKENLRLLQLLQELQQGSIEAPEPLLQTALQLGVKKVVVKRPLKAVPLAGPAPSYTLRGKAIRFDVYVGAGKKIPPIPSGTSQDEPGVQ